MSNLSSTVPVKLVYRTLTPSRFERARVAVFLGSDEASRVVAREIADLIISGHKEGRKIVLGLATGSTPLSVYSELIRIHKEEGVSFSNVVTFNLDEYHPMKADDIHSYHHFMQVHLFDHVDIPASQIHLPSGSVSSAEVDKHCREYEAKIKQAGGIDLQLLGIGRTGHIGFNEPGSAARSRTRLVALDAITRSDAAASFGGEEHTPRFAITMGVRTILDAKRVLLLALGQHKASVVKAAIEDEPSPQVPASFLQEHDRAEFVLDHAASSELTRYRTPWLVGPLEEQGLTWDERMTRRAILWLSKKKSKAILKLTNEDYNENGLQDMLRVHGSAYDANLAGFYQMQHTITGWPGGRDPKKSRPGDAPVRPLKASSAEIFPKRVVVFSPHPDDDVISMGGTLCRLVDHGHEVHVAYQVSGASAVNDEAVWRYLSFSKDVGLVSKQSEQTVKSLCSEFETTGQIKPSAEVWRWKGLIRRNEAAAAARICGVSSEHLHFLDLPFYDSGPVRNRKLEKQDTDIIQSLLKKIQPHLIFAAGDLDDPHGTHRLCLHALRNAIDQSKQDAWLKQSELWLYRGAWAEWAPDEIDMAVPLSPQEVMRRRSAIFKHATQKDQALFLGADQREFWQRAEDRGSKLAASYNGFGLAEYEAIEAFKRLSPEDFLTHIKL
jgi:glucosamine-6-phosphate deaminase